MSTITVRNLDEQVKSRLRRRAAASGHSMEEEVRKVLGLSVGLGEQDQPKDGADLLRRIRARVEPLGGIALDIPPREPGREPPSFE